MIKGRKTGRRRGIGDTRGSSMMYVILLVTLLAVLSSGYMAITQYNMKAALNSRRYMEAQLSAKTIHRSFCEAVSSGDSEAMNLLWQCFGEDCDRIQEEFDSMMDDEEEDSGMEEETDFQVLDEDVHDDAADEGRWERYLYHALGEKEYVIRGKNSQDSQDGTGPEVDITLTALPLKASARVHTRVEYNGYRFSMMADIVFDDSDGAVMTIKNPFRSRGENPADMRIYLNGNGVYRYYEDGSY